MIGVFMRALEIPCVSRALFYASIHLQTKVHLLFYKGPSMVDGPFYWLALSLTPGVGSILIKRLLDRFRTPEDVFRAPLKELLKIEGLGEKVAREIQRGPVIERVEREFNLLKEMGGKIVTLQDEDYPKRLRDIYDPPALLYVRGELKRQDELAVAIVGSRKTTPYGRRITEKMSYDL